MHHSISSGTAGVRARFSRQAPALRPRGYSESISLKMGSQQLGAKCLHVTPSASNHEGGSFRAQRRFRFSNGHTRLLKIKGRNRENRLAYIRPRPTAANGRPQKGRRLSTGASSAEKTAASLVDGNNSV